MVDISKASTNRIASFEQAQSLLSVPRFEGRKRWKSLSTWRDEDKYCFLKGISIARKNRSEGELYINKAHEGRIQKAPLNQSSGTAGGYITPVEYTDLMMETLAEESIIWPRAMVVPMTSDELLFPFVNAAGTTFVAGQSPFFGGVKFAWGQGGSSSSPSLVETEPTFHQGSLKAWNLIGYAILSNQYVADLTPEGEEFLVRLFGRAAAWYSEYAFVNGTGVANGLEAGQPVGLINAPSSYLQPRQSGGNISQTDVGNMVAAFIPECFSGAIWLASPAALGSITQIPGYISNQFYDEQRVTHVGTLVSRPVFVTEHCPNLGTKGDLILTDPTKYVIGDRMQTVIDASKENQFKTNQTVFKIWMRVDGQPLLDGTVTLASGATAGQTVVLV